MVILLSLYASANSGRYVHSWVFKKIDVSPEGSNEHGNISDHSQNSINGDHKLVSVRSAFKASYNLAIIFICIGVSINTTQMRIVNNRKFHEALIVEIMTVILFDSHS